MIEVAEYSSKSHRKFNTGERGSQEVKKKKASLQKTLILWEIIIDACITSFRKYNENVLGNKLKYIFCQWNTNLSTSFIYIFILIFLSVWEGFNK